jgi:hypothetical protein
MPRTATPATYRDRVQEFKRVPTSELLTNSGNFRRHPQAQDAALTGVLKEIGIAGALLAYYSAREDGKLTLIDGELRHGKGGTWPVLILDVDDAEADLLLATHDQLAAMAQHDADPLRDLLERVQSGEAAVQALLTQMAQDAGIVPPDDTEKGPKMRREQTPADQWLIVIECSSEEDQTELLERFNDEGLTCRALVS